MIAVALGAIGMRRLFSRGVPTAIAAVVLLVPALVMYAEARTSEKFLFEWYLIFILPGLCVAVAAGWFDLAPRGAANWWKACVGLGAVGLVAAYLSWTEPQRRILMRQSIQPYREAVLLTRPSLDPNADGQTEILTAFFHAGPLVYDPRIVPVRTLPELQELTRRADSEGRSLYLNVAFPLTAASAQPEIFDFVEGSGWFEEVATLRGFNADLDMWVLHYKPRTAGRPGDPAGP
jgi:hypothetical protein